MAAIRSVPAHSIWNLGPPQGLASAGSTASAELWRGRQDFARDFCAEGVKPRIGGVSMGYIRGSPSATSVL